MILLFGAEKGGTGKTTLAVNLAIMRMLSGVDLLFIDADRSEDASKFFCMRDNNSPMKRVTYVQKYGVTLHMDIRSLRPKYTDIFIDTAGFDSHELRAALVVADIVVTPLCPAQFDVWSIVRHNHIVGEVKLANPNIKSLIVFNKASTNPRVQDVLLSTQKIIDADLQHIKLASSCLGARYIFQKVEKGKSIVELNEPGNKGVQELEKLYKEIFNG